MRRLRVIAAAVLGAAFALLPGAGALAAGVVPILDRALPDLDRPLAAVLDLDTGGLAPAPRPASFATEEQFKAALAGLGDLAYDDAQGGLLFVASGRGLPLGNDAPGQAELRELFERLEPRQFLRGPEIVPGSWFAVRTRSGKLALGFVVARDGEALRLRWSAPRAGDEPVRVDGIEVPGVSASARVSRAWLPPVAPGANSVLRLADGGLVPGPVLPDPLPAQDLETLVGAVGRTGDLAFLRLRSARLIVGSGKLAALGTGPVAALTGRDLRPRLRERSTVAANGLVPGSVLLVETVGGLYALVRIDDVEANGLRVTWSLQPNGTATFPDLAAFDATFEVSDPRRLGRLLLAAAARGDDVALRRLLALGADPNASRGRDARPALTLAVIDGDVGVVATLLDAGANPDQVDGRGWNALHVAAQLGREKIVEALVAAGVDGLARTPDGRDALQLALASSRQNLEVLRLLRAQPGARDTLVLAARLGDLDALAALLAGGSALDLRGEGGETALEVAAAAGEEEAVRMLLAAGADPSIESKAGGSALLLAVSAGRVATAGALLEHAGVPDGQKAAALYRANELGSSDLVRGLLRGGADAALARRDGLTPLEHALQYGSESVVTAYLEDGYALSPAAAARLGWVEQLDALLEEGAAPSEASADGRLPVQHAIENDRIDALRVLLDHGAGVDAALPTWDQRSPLHEAAARPDPMGLALLLERGAAPNPLDRVGRSPLYRAVAQGREEAARLLLESGADPNLAPRGEALLEIASGESMRQLLVNHGARADPDASPR